MSMQSKQVLFFDGVCNLCNGFVDFIVVRDRKNLISFAPLQGGTAKQYLPLERINELNTVVLWREGKIFEKSDAALMVLTQLGGIWGLTKVFWIVPKVLRDLVYDLVARYRYALFGKRETCRLPTQEERKRFLD